MTVRGVARIALGVAASVVAGLAAIVVEGSRAALERAGFPREALRRIGHTESPLDRRLNRYEAHGWPHEDQSRRNNVGWGT